MQLRWVLQKIKWYNWWVDLLSQLSTFHLGQVFYKKPQKVLTSKENDPRTTHRLLLFPKQRQKEQSSQRSLLFLPIHPLANSRLRPFASEHWKFTFSEIQYYVWEITLNHQKKYDEREAFFKDYMAIKELLSKAAVNKRFQFFLYINYYYYNKKN